MRRLGQGACAVALLVEREGQEYVLKVASNPEHNQRLQDEGEVLQQCRHPHIVAYCDMFAMGDRMCVLMHRAGQETLGQRLRKEDGCMSTCCSALVTTYWAWSITWKTPGSPIATSSRTISVWGHGP